jgi:hypothetical protein
MTQSELTTTALVLDLTPGDLDSILDELRAYHAIFSPLFRRPEQCVWSQDYLHGLLLEIPRKSVEPMVLHLHGAERNTVRAMQQFVSEGAWDDAAILRQLWHELATDLADADGVLILDGSDFPKQGQESVGVARQYCGQVGKTANCQAGVFLAYASQHGYALLDRRLYLPEAWFTQTYAQRRKACGVPDDLSFATKSELGASMIEAVVQAGILPCRWLTCDEGLARIQNCSTRSPLSACGTELRCRTTHGSGARELRPRCRLGRGAGRSPNASGSCQMRPRHRRYRQWPSSCLPSSGNSLLFRKALKGRKSPSLPSCALWRCVTRCRDLTCGWCCAAASRMAS